MEDTRSRVTWNAEITQHDVPELLLPSYRLDFIGRNEREVIGEVVDFEKREFFLEADNNKLDNVTYALSNLDRLGKAFVIGDEPNRSEYRNQHAAWRSMSASGRIELVPTDETERLVEYLEARGVQPWRGAERSA